MALLPQPARLFGHNSLPVLEHVEAFAQFKDQFNDEFAAAAQLTSATSVFILFLFVIYSRR